MPQIINVEGVGGISFPDEMSQDEIQRLLDRDFGGKPPEVSGPEAAVESGLANIIPGAGFVYGSIPGAKLGFKMGSRFGPIGAGIGSIVGGLATGIPSQMLAEKGQKELVEATLPEFAKEAESRLAAGAQQHPWWSMAGATTSLGASAKASIPKLAEIPFRAMLGLGIGAVGPMISERRLPTAPEMVGGVLAGTIFGGPRGLAEPVAPAAPPALPEVRAQREAALLAGAKESGRAFNIIEGEIPGRPGAVALPTKEGVMVSRKNFHEQLEQELGKGVPMEEAISNVIAEESIHSTVEDAVAKDFYSNLTATEKWIVRRMYHGGDYKGPRLTDTQYGHEAIRFAFQRVKGMRPGEHIFGTEEDIRNAKVLTKLQDVIRWVREKWGTDASKKNLSYLSKIDENINAYTKGVKDALDTKTAQVFRPVRDESVKVKEEVPAEKTGTEDDARRGEEKLAEDPQLLLKKAEAQSKVIEGLEPGEAIIESAVMSGGGGAFGRGRPVYGPNHPDILDKLDPTGILRNQFSTRESRDTWDFGYRTNKRPFVSRMSLRVRKTGKPPHSDDIPSAIEPGVKVGDQSKGAKVKMIITKAEEAALKKLGYTQEQINAMRPDEAARILEAKAPPVAPTKGAQPTQVVTGEATTPVVPITAGAPAAGAKISTTIDPVKAARLAELKTKFSDPNYVPTSEELKEHSALTRPFREAAIAEARAKRAAASEFQIPTLPAMQRRGKRQIPDDQVAEEVVKVMSAGGEIFTPEELQKRAYSLAKYLADLSPEKRGKALDKFQMEWSKTLDKLTEQKMAKAGILHTGDVSDEAKGIIQQVEAETGMKILPIMPMATWQMLNEGQIAHLNKKVKTRQVQAPVNEKGEPIISEEMVDTGKKDKEGRPIYKVKSGPLQKEGKPVSKAERIYYDYGDYGSYLRSLRALERTRFEQTGQDIHIPEEYIRQAWRANVEDFLTNASLDTIKDLLRAAGQDLERGRFRGVMSDLDPADILSALDREYPQPGTPEFEKYKAFNTDPATGKPYTDEKAIEVLRMEREAAETKLKRFAQTRRIDRGQALELLRKMSEADLAEVNELLEQKRNWVKVSSTEFEEMLEGKPVIPETKVELPVGKVQQEEIRKGRELAKKRRQKAIGFLDEFLKKPALPPVRDPSRLRIGRDEIDTYITLTPQQASDTALMRMELWRGTHVKGISPARLTKGVMILSNPFSGEYHGVSFYLDPKSKDLMVYDPNFLPGDKTRKHLHLNTVMSLWTVKSMMLLEQPVNRFHQKWKNADAFKQDIGDIAMIKELGSAELMLRYQRHLEAKKKPMTEAEKKLAAQKLKEEGEVAEPVSKEEVSGEEAETAEERRERKAIEAAWATTDFSREFSVSERERLAKMQEEEGLRPGEAGLIGTQVRGEGYLQGPGTGEIGLLKTDPRYLARGPLTGIEAEAIANTFSEHELSGRPITDVESLLKMLDRLQFRRTHISWFTKKPRGLRGRDYAFASGLDKMVRFWQARILKEPEVRIRLRELGPVPKDKPYSEMTNKERAKVDYLEGKKFEALIEALTHANEIAQESKFPAAEAKEGTFPYDAEQFKAKALEVYGDTTQRDLKRLALATERAAQERSISGERSLLAGSKFGGAPRVVGKPIASYPQTFPRPEGAPVETLTPEGVRNVEAQARAHIPPRLPDVYKPYLTPKGAEATEGAIVKGEDVSKKFVPMRQTAFEMRGIKGPGVEELGRPQGMPIEQWHPAMQRRGRRYEYGHGVSNRVWALRVERGQSREISGTVGGMKRQEAINIGKDRWKSWHDTNYMMDLAAETGRFNQEDVAVARYGGLLLDRKADSLAEQYTRKSPEYKAAQEASDDWQQKFHDAFKTPASDIFRTMQGEQDPESGYTYFYRELKDTLGREPTEKEGDELWILSHGIEGMKDSIDETVNEIGQVMSKPKPIDPALNKMAGPIESQSEKMAQEAAARIQKLFGEEPQMALKGGEIPPLDPKALSDLSQIGSDVMMKLSKADDLTIDRWKEEMRKRPEIGTKFDPNLDQIYAASEAFRDEFLNRFVGQGDATKPLKNMFSRKRPTLEESFAAVHRALGADPHGRKPSQQEAFHVWNIIKQVFLDRGVRDFDEIRVKGSELLGIKPSELMPEGQPYTEMRLYRALGTKRTLRKLTLELIRKQREEARIIAQAKNWITNQMYPGWLQFVRKVPRFFFMDKIFGHGMVPLITHAGNMMFNPWAWKTYFPAWRDMYRMTFGEEPIRRLVFGKKGGLTADEYHKLRLRDITNHPNFEMWRQANLQIDPFRFTDDYQIAALQGFFAGTTGGKIKRGLERAVAGWGFDALKTLRLARAEQWWNSLPEHLKVGETGKRMAELIAEDVNHATGIVTSKFHESANWLLFAPKLEASRWAFMFKDTIKALDYLRRWNTSTLEQRSWAKSVLAQKAVMVGMYYSMLAMSQGLLKAVGSDQDINITDPRKPDFMYFKIPGFKIGVISPMIGIVKLFANMLHAGQGELRPLEKLSPRQTLMDTAAGKYVRGKFSPFASFAYDVFSGQDPTGRPFPWSEDVLPRYKRLQGIEPYTPTEYVLETIAPIPGEEFVREIWSSMGADESAIKRILRSLAVAGTMGMTGARVTQDEPD